ncbi:MAG TPA: heme ABC exporter ATP-binding protein CcmA [Ktedonobacterales bacterium]|nr:heme ABC exporter ATP-binding protein CcmA [Ktedonobacterales bacterium]
MNAHLVAFPREASVEQHPSLLPAIEVTGLGKTYELRPVLRNISFTLKAGGTAALLGANGAGKTTLLRILATLVKPSAGQGTVMGYDVVRDAAALRRLIGYVGHQPHVYDDLTARENLLFFARMYGLAGAAKRTDALLERVGLRAKSRERVRTLSRGQTQRLAIARGILHEPRLLLLDEPDTGLDEEASTLLDELITERAATGGATLLTTHNIAHGLSRGEDTLVLAGGRLTYNGPSRALSPGDVRELFVARRRER